WQPAPPSPPSPPFAPWLPAAPLLPLVPLPACAVTACRMTGPEDAAMRSPYELAPTPVASGATALTRSSRASALRLTPSTAGLPPVMMTWLLTERAQLLAASYPP